MSIHNFKRPTKNSLILLLAFFSCYLNIGLAETSKTYTVGVVPQFEARKLYGIWRPLLDQLEKETGLTFKLQGSHSIPDFEKKLASGKFDFAYMNPYHLIWSQETQRYQPLIRDHSRKLQGLIVVRKDDPIASVEQLDGKVLAFPAPNALGASLMIRAELHNKFNINIIPHYVKTHDSVYLNVIYNKVAAGGGVQKTLDRQKSAIKDKLRILYRTQQVAPHPFGVHPRVDKRVATLVQQALINISKTTSGRALLAKVPIKETGVAFKNDYKPLLQMGLDKFRAD